VTGYNQLPVGEYSADIQKELKIVQYKNKRISNEIAQTFRKNGKFLYPKYTA
jgi:ribosomal protein L6P/L9E